MEITFIGHACFSIKGKDATIVIDPYNPDKIGYKLPKLTSDILLVSHEHFDHSYTDGVNVGSMTIDEAGEYEVKDVYIDAIPTFHDENEGKDRGTNLMFQIQMDGLTILHTGDLGHELGKETLEKLIEIDVLLVPVGGSLTIDAKAASKVISSVEPGIVVPMHYQTKDLTGLSKELDPLKKFLDEMGDTNTKEVDKLKVSGKNDVPEETEIVVLNPAH